MKKGFALIYTLIAFLILIFAIYIIYSFAGDLKSVLKEDAEIETCKLSVLAQAQTRKIPLVGDSPKTIIPLDCPRRSLKIYEDKVEINGAKSKKYSFKELKAEELNHIIAEELRLCWYKMAEGSQNVFENSIFFGVDRACLICSEIDFDDKLNGKTYNGLIDYLKANKIPKTGTSYYDYISKSQRNLYLLNNIPWTQWLPWGTGTTRRISEETLSSEQKYLIYFLAYKPAAFSEAIGELSTAYYIGLGKEEIIRGECSILVN